VFGEQPLMAHLVDAVDDAGRLLQVTRARGQRERRRHQVEHAEEEEAAHPAVTPQVRARPQQCGQ
jgi:hypothetical protein